MNRYKWIVLVLLLLPVAGVFAQPPIVQEAVLSGHRDWVNALAWNPDSTRLASASADGTLRIWDVQSAATLHLLNGGGASMVSVAWHPGGALLVGGALDDQIQFWDAETGEAGQRFVGHTGDVWGLAWVADGALLASTATDHTLRIWNPDATANIIEAADEAIFILESDGKSIAIATYGGQIRLWSAQGDLLNEIQSQTPIIALSWRDNLLAGVGGAAGFTLWDAQTGAIIQAKTTPRLAYSVAISPDGRLVAVGGDDGSIDVFATATYEPLQTLSAHTDFVADLAFSPDGKYLASAGYDGLVVVWRVP